MFGLKERFARFMYGRYGMDSLQKAICVLIIVSAIASIFTDSAILSLVNTALFVILLLRMFSKNYAARSKENQMYLKFFGKFLQSGKLLKMRFTDRKTHRYRVCPFCKAVMRLPIKKGTHTVKCRQCSNDFTVKISF